MTVTTEKNFHSATVKQQGIKPPTRSRLKAEFLISFINGFVNRIKNFGNAKYSAWGLFIFKIGIAESHKIRCTDRKKKLVPLHCITSEKNIGLYPCSSRSHKIDSLAWLYTSGKNCYIESPCVVFSKWCWSRKNCLFFPYHYLDRWVSRTLTSPFIDLIKCRAYKIRKLAQNNKYVNSYIIYH